MNLTEWAVLVCPGVPAGPAAAAYGLYARVSSHDQREGLDRQVARLTTWAADAGGRVVRVEAEVGSGVSGSRAKARRLLADPKVSAVVVEHRDRLGRVNTELAGSGLAAHGRRLVVLDDGEADNGPGAGHGGDAHQFLCSPVRPPVGAEPGAEGGRLRPAGYRPAGGCRCRRAGCAVMSERASLGAAGGLEAQEHEPPPWLRKARARAAFLSAPESGSPDG